MRKLFPFVCGLPLVLSGCGGVTGLMNASDEFGCPIGSGVNCTTLTDTYNREDARKIAEEKAKAASAAVVVTRPVSREIEDIRTLNKSRQTPLEGASTQASSGDTSNTKAVNDKKSSVPPIIRRRTVVDERVVLVNEGRRFVTRLEARAPEEVLMVWVLPWIDATGDLHDASRVWMRVEDAKWRIEGIRTRAMESPGPGVEP